MSDSQLRPGFTAPKNCPQGCARWDNIAADGNTWNQSEANQWWAQGQPPENAGNMCAQPVNNPGQGPWCLCAGTNDASSGLCQDKNLAASACKAVPNGLNKLNSEISNCTSSTEYNRNTNFADNTFKLQQDISSSAAAIGDSLSMGDAMFGQYGYNDIAKQVKDRNEELKTKKATLLTEVEKGEAIIERSNRDFSDVKDTIPQPQPKRVLRFIEDYTLAILSISYLFMIIAAIYIYTSMSDKKLVAFFQILIGSILLTMFLFMMLFYLA
jgi:hypothetical protein